MSITIPELGENIFSQVLASSSITSPNRSPCATYDPTSAVVQKYPAVVEIIPSSVLPSPDTEMVVYEAFGDWSIIANE
jgi:hypothetical protein